MSGCHGRQRNIDRAARRVWTRMSSTTTPLFLVASHIRSLLTDPAYFWILSALVIAGDAVLTQLIVCFVPCKILQRQIIARDTVTNPVPDTEIDWETYMIHISLYNQGENDYAQIKGPTGPLV